MTPENESVKRCLPREQPKKTAWTTSTKCSDVLFLLMKHTEGDMNSPACPLIFMRWCQVLAGDISLRIREGAERRAVGDD